MKKIVSRQTMAQRTLNYISANGLLAGVKSLVVAVSGGPDSVCLLDTLLRIKTELNINLHVAHVNHGLRGAESDADADYVRNLALKCGLPAAIEKRDVNAYRAKKRLSMEEAAREVRYAFLADVAAATGSSCIAVGHTLDDNIETILMHLVRGSGVSGLRGLLPANNLEINGKDVRLVRPLLEITREETNQYCIEGKLEPRTDATNASLEPFRNRVRHDLIPLLAGYNPRIKDALLRTAVIAGEETDYLISEANRCWETVAQVKLMAIVLDKPALTSLHPALQRHLLRRAVLTLAGTLKDFESGHVDDMLELLKKPAGRSLNLPDWLVFSVEYNRYILAYTPAALCPFPEIEGELLIKVPGEIRIPGWSLTAEIEPENTFSENVFNAYLSCDSLENIYLRARKPGDLFQPMGMGVPMKLKDFMVNAKIPRAWRTRVPVVARGGDIMWVGGWRIDERYKVTPNTKQILHLRMERRSDDES